MFSAIEYFSSKLVHKSFNEKFNSARYAAFLEKLLTKRSYLPIQRGMKQLNHTNPIYIFGCMITFLTVGSRLSIISNALGSSLKGRRCEINGST